MGRKKSIEERLGKKELERLKRKYRFSEVPKGDFGQGFLYGLISAEANEIANETIRRGLHGPVDWHEIAKEFEKQ